MNVKKIKQGIYLGVETSIRGACKYSKIAIGYAYLAVGSALYIILLPFYELLKLVCFAFYVLFQSLKRELFLLFNVTLVLVVTLACNFSDELQIYKHTQMYFTRKLLESDIYPFPLLLKKHMQVVRLRAEVLELESRLDIADEPVLTILKQEAERQGVPLRIALAILKNENARANTQAYNVNKNMTFDAGVMQVNSANFRYCKITPKEAFSARKNIRCGMLILSDAYRTAKRYAHDRYYTCTKAETYKERVLEWTARIYNGGAGVRKGVSCDYATRFSVNYLKLR